MFSLLSKRHRLSHLSGLAIVAVIVGFEVRPAAAQTEPHLEYALYVSGGMTGAVSTEVLLYDSGLVIRLDPDKIEPVVLGQLQNPNWVSSQLETVAHDQLVAELRASLEQGRRCKPGPPIPDGIGASIFEISRAAPATATNYELDLPIHSITDPSCEALAASYEKLDALQKLPSHTWQPQKIIVTLATPASPMVAQAEPLPWPSGWATTGDPSTSTDSIGRWQVFLDASPEVHQTLNDLIEAAKKQGRPILIDGTPLNIAFARYVLPGSELLHAKPPPVSSSVPRESVDQCKAGFVWRAANPRDYVCVTPQSRDRVIEENRQAVVRRDPNGAYGPNTCKAGFVWREAFFGDVVCVTPDIREATKTENRLRLSRRVAR